MIIFDYIILKIYQLLNLQNDKNLSSNKIKINKFESKNVAVNLDLNSNKINFPEKKKAKKKVKKKLPLKLYNLSEDVKEFNQIINNKDIVSYDTINYDQDKCYKCNKKIFLHSNRTLYRGFDNYLCYKCYNFYSHNFISN
jgi:predicted transcriptional regulator